MNQFDHQRREAQHEPHGQRQAGAAYIAATHDMLILNSRPDLTPDFPAGMTHQSPQRAQPYPAPGRHRP